MSTSLPKIKIYSPIIDELKAVTTPAEVKAWEERMIKECGNNGFKITGSMKLLDTCCGGKADDCGLML